MGKKLVLELYFSDSVNEEEMEAAAIRGLDKAGLCVGDSCWKADDNYGEEE